MHVWAPEVDSPLNSYLYVHWILDFKQLLLLLLILFWWHILSIYLHWWNRQTADIVHWYLAVLWDTSQLLLCPDRYTVLHDIPWPGCRLMACHGRDTVLLHIRVGMHVHDMSWSGAVYRHALVRNQFYGLPWSWHSFMRYMGQSHIIVCHVWKCSLSLQLSWLHWELIILCTKLKIYHVKILTFIINSTSNNNTHYLTVIYSILKQYGKQKSRIAVQPFCFYIPRDPSSVLCRKNECICLVVSWAGPHLHVVSPLVLPYLTLLLAAPVDSPCCPGTGINTLLANPMILSQQLLVVGWNMDMWWRNMTSTTWKKLLHFYFRTCKPDNGGHNILICRIKLLFYHFLVIGHFNNIIK